MIRSFPRAVVLASLLAAAVPIHAADAPHDLGVDLARVGAAIAKGANFICKDLDKNLKPYQEPGHGQCDDTLILYALVKAGGNSTARAEFKKVLDHCLKRKLSKTYQAAVLAMALEAYNPGVYKGYIRNCAQFLIDNQCANGQWEYGKPVDLPTPSLDAGFTASSSGSGGEVIVRNSNTRAKTPMKRRGSGPAVGDNSNTQYALLGLRACEDAGFKVPYDTWRRALQAWVSSQRQDGGWNYDVKHNEGSYLSMTEGGIGSVVICMHFLQRSWKSASSLNRAYTFVSKRFGIPDNPIGRHKGQSAHEYYHIYAIERAGMLADRENFGPHRWYQKGAEWLMANQRGDGSWLSKRDMGHAVRDTCFAMLFLSRATRPIVYSGH
jgi:hypothetical protein